MNYEEELIKEREMISAKYDGKKFKYWWYKRRFNKLREKLYNKKGGI